MNLEKPLEILDEFAQSALNALISKMPFYDVEGEFGNKIEPEKMVEIKKQLTASAYEYAGWMMISRENMKDWLSENIEINPSFGTSTKKLTEKQK